MGYGAPQMIVALGATSTEAALPANVLLTSLYASICNVLMA